MSPRVEAAPGGLGLPPERILRSPGEIGKALVAVRQAQGVWAALAPEERARRLKGAGRILAARVEDLAGLIHRENGKLPLDALAAELIPAVMAFKYYLRRAPAFLKSRPIRGSGFLMANKRSRLLYRPYGVVGIISPWNYPLSIPFSEMLMALLAGNGVILKTASLVPGIGQALAAIFDAADLPPALVAYAELPGQDAGPAFIAAGVDKLFFTGSTAVGRDLMALAAPRLLPLVLELGGADAAIIRADADLDRAAAGIVWAGFANAGQSCGGVQRVFVHQAVYPAFLEKLTFLTEKLRPGIDLGPLVSLRQKKEVQKQVEACLRAGARISAQSPGMEGPGDSPFLPAMVLTDLGADSPFMTGEVFGPVVGVVPVADDEEALRWANASSYGLTGSVWSRNPRRARELAARINAGAVTINDHLMSHGLAETPWGGFGESGLGRTHGEIGFREMCKTQVVVEETLPGIRRNLWWHPYSEKTYRRLLNIVDFLGGRTLVKRLRAIPGLAALFFRYWEK